MLKSYSLLSRRGPPDGKVCNVFNGYKFMAKLHLVMGMGKTARTEIADRELASTRERPASRDESPKHNTQRQMVA